MWCDRDVGGIIGRTISRSVRPIRKALGWTQDELAARADTSQALISRLETGKTDLVDLDVADRIIEALGARVDIALRRPFLANGGLQRDAAHALISAYVRRWLERLGWEVEQEVEVGGPRSRGWIDILAFHRVQRVCLVDELKTDVDDIGAVQRQMSWYENDAWIAATRLGWQPVRIASAVMLLDTQTNHRRISENRELLAQFFPIRARELGAWLADPVGQPPPRGRVLALVDPLTRRSDWLRASPTDGRRSPAADADYASFMDRARRRR